MRKTVSCLWFVVYGLWFMVYGLWFLKSDEAYRIQTTRELVNFFDLTNIKP